MATTIPVILESFVDQTIVEIEGSFVINDINAKVISELPIGINFPTLNIQFTPLDFYYDRSGIYSYCSWRSVNISGNTPGPPDYPNIYPKYGYSFDIWSISLYDFIVTYDYTWAEIYMDPFLIVDYRSYSVLENKNTIIYDYDNLEPIYYFTQPPPPSGTASVKFYQP